VTHQTHSGGKPYVRITFEPHDANKTRRVWAIKIGPCVYMRAGEDGGIWLDPKAPAAFDRREVIITGADIVEEPAGVSLHYGQMEVLP